jgi:hypothetical protein
MKLHKTSAQKAKQHTVYKNSRGVRLPGCTTVTGILNKPVLVGWANRLGLDGIDVRKYVDELADIGTTAHYMIECHINSQIKGKTIVPDLDQFSKNQIQAAEFCFSKYLTWEAKQKIKYLHSELILVSDELGFGGTIDIIAELNGVLTLMDIKTCKGIYKDHNLQVFGGYVTLAREHGYKVEEARIIRVGRSEEEGDEAEEKKIPNGELYQQMFMKCLEIYQLKKVLGM